MKKKNLHLILFLLGFIAILLCSTACNKNKYKIIYDTYGGSKIKTETFELGETAYLKEPTKDGYHFVGWYKDNRFIDGPYESICTNKPCKITVYACWETDEDYEEALVFNKISKVYKLIETIPEDPTIKDIELIQEANSLYNEIPKEYQEVLINYDKLQNALDELPNLIIQNVIREIESLPFYITSSFSEKVERIKHDYDQLSEDGKVQVTNVSKLFNAINDLETIEEDSNKPLIILGEYIYSSRLELHKAFFTEFYYFIARNYSEVLETNEIESLDEFLQLSLNYEAGRGQMRDFADRFSQCFLTKDKNGVIENQPPTTFIGYCYHNNKFREIINFFMTFFAYWRLDEKYATIYNSGADFFAESWAPLVDICKYFYYTEDTSPVKTSRIVDCFKNPAGVAIKLNESSKTYKLRGYNFMGLFSDKEFQNKQYQSQNTPFIYVKWERNQDSLDKEKAKLVDIYIYNLTTYTSTCSSKTVQYVYDMYNRLTFEARRFVTRKEILSTYVESYNLPYN